MSGYIFQTNRHQLLKLVEKNAHFVHGKVLDVGCGPTPRYKHLFACDEYVKMDIEEGPNIDVVGFAEKIPFPDETFDSIVCTETINDVFELHTAFSEFNRVLRRGGVLMVSATNIARSNDHPSEYWRFTAYGMKKLATRAGFTVEVLEQRGAFWSTMAQLVVAYLILKIRPYDKWYERPFGIFASLYGKISIWLDRFEHGAALKAFSNGHLLIVKKS